jgi:CHASE2 domain-containing sensor protein
VAERRRGSLGDLLLWTLRVQPDADETRGRRRHARTRELIKLAVLVVVNAIFNFAGFYERFEWADLDRLQMTANPSRGQVTMVLITDEEYNDPQLFNRTSPLSVATLAKVINAICEFHPRVIGVDLITSDWEADDYREQWPSSPRCPVIWSIDWTEDAEPQERGGTVQLQKVVGHDASAASVCAAVPILTVDPDGTIRNYSVAQRATADTLRTYRTLVWVLARSIQSGAVPCDSGPIYATGPVDGTSSELADRKIRFSANRSLAMRRLRARDVLAAYAQPDELSASIDATLRDAVVILGANFRHARDRYRTPVGALSGSEILANAVVTESDPRHAIDPVDPWVSFIIDLIVGVVLLAVISPLRLRWPFAIAISSAAAVVVALLLSWTLFNYAGYFLGVFGALSGVVLGIIVEASWDSLAAQLKDWYGEFCRRLDVALGRNPS